MKGLRAAAWASAWLAAVHLAAAQGIEPTQAERVQRYRDMKQAATVSLMRIEQKVYEEHDRLLKASGKADDPDQLVSLMIQVQALDQRQIERLRLEMVSILGEPALPGFRPEPQLNVYSLLPHPNSPTLDGLVYEDAAKNGTVTVVPLAMLNDWLLSPRWASKPREQAMAELIDDRVLSVDIGPYSRWGTVSARLPVRTPEGAQHAAALLLDDYSPIHYLPPSGIEVVIIDRDRLYVARQKVRTQLPSARKCLERYNALVRQERVAEANASYRACYTELIRHRPEFLQATREAQALIDRLRPSEAGH
ncbi:MAG TPA: hypothetical protein VK195_16300 [Burkholderiaceae bacterium]|nr:hypothetical protein [Burkholderiaceae bacterium]